MDTEKILAACEHTLLKQTAGWDDIRQVCDDAIEYRTAGVCIPPCFVSPARDYVGDKLMIATVIGFPNGNSTTATKAFEASDAIKNGADEIDMVINIGMLKHGHPGNVTDEIRAVREACGEHPLKVIIETCMLTDEEKIRACEIVSDSGAAYIKTSTGFGGAGATYHDVKLISEHIEGGVKIKASGGIATLVDAQKFLDLGVARLGTSRIVGLVKGM